MNVKIVRIEMAGVERQLERIADMLEQLIYTTNAPQNHLSLVDERERVTYTDERREIVNHYLTKMGKRPKE